MTTEKQNVGKFGEDLAARYLENHGYKFYQIMGGLFKDLQQRSKQELLKDDETKWLLIKKQ